MILYTEYKDDKFFYSLIQEERLQKVKALLELYVEEGLAKRNIIWFGFEDSYGLEETRKFLEAGQEVTEEEVKVLRRLGIKGIDIYKKVEDALAKSLLQDFDEYSCDCYCYVPGDILKKVKEPYLELFGEERWKEATRR